MMSLMSGEYSELFEKIEENSVIQNMGIDYHSERIVSIHFD